MNNKEFIKTEYYKHWKKKNNETSEDDYFKLIFQLFDQLNINSAFEVAIGDGKPFANYLSKQFIVNGIDLSEDLVVLANNNKNIKASYGDAEERYKDNYDLVYCLRSLLLIKKWKKVLENMITSSNKYIIFDVLNGDNKNIIYDEIEFRHTLIGKIYVGFKNTVKYLLNLVSTEEKYFMQPLIPIENYHFHEEIVKFINDNFNEDIEIEYYGIVTQLKNQIDNEKDYRIIYKLTKKDN